jgi:CBS domain-containing protein
MNEMTASENQITRASVRDVMTPDPLTCRPDDHLMDAAARMQQHHVRHLPVIDGDDRLIGMLADRDIRTAVGDPDRWMDDVTPGLEELRVSSAMSSPAVTVPLDSAVGDVARCLVELEVGALPVVDQDGRLVGIVSYIDILRSLRG